MLTMLQRHLICAELDHKVTLKAGTLEELTKEIGSKWSQRALVQRLDDFIKRTGGPNTKVPRSKEERARLLFQTVQKMA